MGEIGGGVVKLVGKVAGMLVDRQATSATCWHFDVVAVLMPLFFILFSIFTFWVHGIRTADCTVFGGTTLTFFS